MKKPLSLRTYLLLLVLAVLVPFAGLVAYLLINQARQDAYSADNNALVLARRTVNPVKREMAQLEGVLSRTAGRPNIRAMDRAKHPGTLDRFLENNKDFASLYVINVAGEVVHCVPQPPKGRLVSFADSAWFAQLLRTGRFTFGPLTNDPLTGKQVSLLACPVREDPAGRLVGALCGGLDLVRFHEVLTNALSFSTAVGTLLDTNGTVLTRSVDAKQWVGKNLRGLEAVRLALTKRQGHLVAQDEDGEERFYGFATLPNTGWRILVGIPYKGALVPAQADATRSLLVASAVAGLTLFLVVWLRRRITRPIQALAQAARKLSQGDWDLQLPLAGPAELAGLANEFNHMAAARQQADASLRLAEEKFQHLIRTASVMVVGLDCAGKVTVFNEAAEKLTGYSRAELEGKNWFELLVPSDRFPQVRAEFDRLLAGGLPRIFENPILTKSGQERLISWSNNEVRAQGQCFGTISFGIDLTERKQAEEALQLAERKYRRLHESMRDGFVLVSMDGRILESNLAYQQILGYSAQELLQLTYLDLTPPKWHAFEADLVKNQVLEHGFSDIYEKEYLRKDGSLVPVELRSYLVTDDQHQPAGMWAIVRDISQRKQVQAERTRLAAILESTSDFVGITSADYSLLYFNLAARRALGIGPREDISHTSISDYHPPSTWHTIRNQIEPATVRDGIWRGEITYRSRDGREISTLAECLVHRSVDSKPEYFSIVARDISAQKLAEQALRNSEQSYRSLVEHSIDGIFLVAPDGRFLEANSAGCQLSGYSREEMLQRKIMDMIVSEELPRAAEVLGEIMAGKTVHNEWTCPRKDGSFFHGELKARRLPDGRILAIMRDVSERLRAEHALRESEEKYKSLIETTNTGFVVMDTQGRVTDANQEYVRLTGHDRLEEIRGRNVMEWTAPHDVERNAQELRKCAERGFVRNLEIGYVRKDGRITPLEISATVITTPDSTSILGLCRDISERKRAEEALRDAELRYRSLVENIPAITYTATPDELRSPLFVSPQIELLGYPRSDWTRNPEFWRQVVHPQDYDRVTAELRSALGPDPSHQPSTTFHCEYRLLTSQGHELWFRDDAVLVRNSSGDPLYLQGVLLDITGLKLAETAVRAVSGRLLSLQEEERRRIARELHDTTGQNLTALMMNLSALRGVVPQKHAAGANALEECFRLTDQCVQEVRTLSYLLHPPVLDELGLARALSDYVAGFQRRSGIKVELDLGSETEALPKETEMTLFRVVQESLGNIHRHSGSRTAAIRMWRDAGEVWLEVQDNGKGLPRAQLKAIEAGESPMGVGIAGMRERMEQLGGRLHIRSGPQGTTVQAVVPIGVAA